MKNYIIICTDNNEAIMMSDASDKELQNYKEGSLLVYLLESSMTTEGLNFAGFGDNQEIEQLIAKYEKNKLECKDQAIRMPIELIETMRKDLNL